MKTRNAEAQRLESQYLAQLRLALAGRSSSEAAEILQSVRDHIDEALEEAPGDEVSAVVMGNVLERLGPPEAFAREEESPDRGTPGATASTPAIPLPAMAPPRVSKLAVASALSLPVAGLVAILVFVLARLAWKDVRRVEEMAILTGYFALLLVLLVGAIVGVAGLVAIRHSAGRLRGKGLAIVGIIVFALAFLLGFGWFAMAIPGQPVQQSWSQVPPANAVQKSAAPVVKITIDLPGAAPETIDDAIGRVVLDGALRAFNRSPVASATAISSAGHFEAYFVAARGVEPDTFLAGIKISLPTQSLPAAATEPVVSLLPEGGSVPVIHPTVVAVNKVWIDRDQAARVKVSAKAIDEALVKAARGEPIDAIDAAKWKSLEDIWVTDADGGVIRLGLIASLSTTTQPSHIVRTLP